MPGRAQVRRRFGRSDVAGEEFGSEVRRDLPHNAASDKVLRGSLLAVLILTPLSFLYLNPSWDLLWSPRSRLLLAEIVNQAWPLDLTLAEVSKLFQLSQATLAMSILAAFVAALGGAFLSLSGGTHFQHL